MSAHGPRTPSRSPVRYDLGMGRNLFLLLMLVLAGLVGWLAGSGGSGAPAPVRTSRGGETSEYRITELELRVERLESRLAAATAGAPPPAPAAQAEQERPVQMRDWLQRAVRPGVTAARGATAQGAPTDGGMTPRQRYEEILERAGPASEEGAQAAFELGYLARNDRDYAASDACFERVQRAVAADSAASAWAEFQLGWNRRFAGDVAASEAHFRRVIDHPAARAGTKAAARYAIAGTRREQGDPAGARSELEALVEAAKPHAVDPTAGYYVGLARQMLDAGGG